MHARVQTTGRLSQNALPGIEVGREGDRRAGVGQRPGGRHRPCEVERGDRQQDGDDVARSELRDALPAGGLEVVDRARAELDGERDGADLA